MPLNPHPCAGVSLQVHEGRALQMGEEGKKTRKWRQQTVRLWQKWLHHSVDTLLLVEETQTDSRSRKGLVSIYAYVQRMPLQERYSSYVLLEPLFLSSLRLAFHAIDFLTFMHACAFTYTPM